MLSTARTKTEPDTVPAVAGASTDRLPEVWAVTLPRLLEPFIGMVIGVTSKRTRRLCHCNPLVPVRLALYEPTGTPDGALMTTPRTDVFPAESVTLAGMLAKRRLGVVEAWKFTDPVNPLILARVTFHVMRDPLG